MVHCSVSMAEHQLLSRRLVEESSSDDDDDEFIFSAAQIVQDFLSVPKRKHGGSVPGHIYIYRDRAAGHDRMYQDYLADNPTFGPTLFRRRFMCTLVFFFTYAVCNIMDILLLFFR